MTTTKQKLLEILSDMDIGDLEENMLIDILQHKVNSQEALIKATREELFQDRHRLNQEIEHTQQTRRELRENPLAIMAGVYYFRNGGDGRYMVEIKGGRIEMWQKSGDLMGKLMAISPSEFCADVDETQAAEPREE